MDDIIAVTLLVADTLERLDVPYVVGGSLASSFHGIPRATIDADLVAALRQEHRPALVTYLHGPFYLDDEAIRTAIEYSGGFNLIHIATMYKVDVFVAGEGRATKLELERGRSFVVANDPERTLRFATAEDTIVQKLHWYELGDSVRGANVVIAQEHVVGVPLGFDRGEALIVAAVRVKGCTLV